VIPTGVETQFTVYPYVTTAGVFGDLNDDGWGDIVFGGLTGHAYLYLGGASFPPAVNISTTPTDSRVVVFETTKSNCDLLFPSVAARDTNLDLNGDGIDDLFLTCDEYLFLVYGGSYLTGTFDLDSAPTSQVIVFNAPGQRLSYVNMADVNKDGNFDIFVGNPGANSDEGGAYLIYGTGSWSSPVDITTLNPSQCVSFTATGLGANAALGKFASIVGDLDGDGYLEMVATSPDYSVVGIGFLIYGAADLTSQSDLWTNAVKLNSSISNAFGWNSLGLGDLNNDGFDEWVVSAPSNGAINNYVFVAYGSSQRWNSYHDFNLGSGEKVIGAKYNTSQNAGTFLRLIQASDINGDGNPDYLLCEAYWYGITGENDGRCYVLYGEVGGVLPNYIDIDEYVGEKSEIQGISDFAAYFGNEGGAGDVNGDGVADLVVATLSTEVYLIFGVAPSPTPSPSNTQTPLPSLSNSAQAVTSSSPSPYAAVPSASSSPAPLEQASRAPGKKKATVTVAVTKTVVKTTKPRTSITSL